MNWASSERKYCFDHSIKAHSANDEGKDYMSNDIYADLLGLGHKIAEIWDLLGPVNVYENDYQRYLTFGSIYEQSCQKKADPGYLMHEHTRAMMLPLVFHDAERVTILGLGGGSLANCLYSRFPAMQLVAVENRQVVIDLAHQYFEVPYDPRLSIQCEDASAFVESAKPGSTDFLLCDLYNANGVNALQCDPTFLSQCHALLREGGWAAFNYFGGHHETAKALRFLQWQFETVFVCDLFTGNQIVVAAKKPLNPNREALLQRAKGLEQHLGCSIVNEFLRLSRANRKGYHLPIFE